MYRHVPALGYLVNAGLTQLARDKILVFIDGRWDLCALNVELVASLNSMRD